MEGFVFFGVEFDATEAVARIQRQIEMANVGLDREQPADAIKSRATLIFTFTIGHIHSLATEGRIPARFN